MTLRCWEPADAAALLTALSESLAHLRRWLEWARNEPQPLEEKTAMLRRFRARFESGRDFPYGIFDRQEKAVLGAAALHRRIGAGAAEIGYWVHSGHVNRGIATEAAAVLTQIGLQALQFQRIEIQCDPSNAASAAIPRKLGYNHQVTIAGCVRQADAPARDNMVWAIGPQPARTFESFGSWSIPES